MDRKTVSYFCISDHARKYWKKFGLSQTYLNDVPTSLEQAVMKEIPESRTDAFSILEEKGTFQAHYYQKVQYWRRIPNENCL